MAVPTTSSLTDVLLTTNCTEVTSDVPEAEASSTAAVPLRVAPFEGTRIAVCSGRGRPAVSRANRLATRSAHLALCFPRVNLSTKRDPNL